MRVKILDLLKNLRQIYAKQTYFPNMALFFNVKNTSKISANSFPLSRTQLLKNRFPRWRAPAQQEIRHNQTRQEIVIAPPFRQAPALLHVLQ